MTWEIRKADETHDLIMDGDRLSGSIVAANHGLYRVEILWSGRGGDLRYTAKSKQAAEAFVKGVEQMLDRWGSGPEPELIAKPDNSCRCGGTFRTHPDNWLIDTCDQCGEQRA